MLLFGAIMGYPLPLKYNSARRTQHFSHIPIGWPSFRNVFFMPFTSPLIYARMGFFSFTTRRCMCLKTALGLASAMHLPQASGIPRGVTSRYFPPHTCRRIYVTTRCNLQPLQVSCYRAGTTEWSPRPGSCPCTSLRSLSWCSRCVLRRIPL